MITHKAIRNDLINQQKIEGFTPETALLLKVLPLCKYSSEWRTLTVIKWQKDDTRMHRYHKFYYPSKLLTDLELFFTEDKTAII